MNADIPLSFDSPESSAMSRATYDPGTRILEIDLKRGTKTEPEKVVTYRFASFPASMWEEFTQSESKGRYFSEHIRPHFAGVKKD